VGNKGFVGERGLYRRESSIPKLFLRGARRSRVVSGNSSGNFFDSNILNCNRLF